MSYPTSFTTYDAWVGYPYASRIVLLELEAAERPETWTATPGMTGVYQTAFASQVLTNVITGGLYRRMEGVEENGTLLVEEASAAAVDANPGSWFHNGTTLYVATTTGSNPTELASVNAVFRIFLASESLDVVGGELYEGRLGQTFPQVDGQVDSLYGAKVYTTGEFTLANGDGLFDTIAATWAWHGREAVMLLGGRELPLAEFQPVGRMRVDRLLPGDDYCRVVLMGEQDVFGRFLPLRTFTRAEYPLAGDDAPGTYVPLLLGTVEGILPVMTDRTEGATVYLVADPQVQTLSAVWDVRVLEADAAPVGLAEGVDYTVSLANCTITLLRADLTQRQIMCSASSATAGATMPAAISKLLEWLGEPTASINATSFTAAAVLRPEAFGLWLRDGLASAEYFSILEASMLAALVRDRDGLWSLEVDDFEIDLSATPHLEDGDWAAWNPLPGQPGVEEQVSSVRVRFRNVPYASAWDETEASSDTTRYLQRSERSWSVDTALVLREDAARLAQHYRLLLLDRPVQIEIRERGLQLMTAGPAQVMRATRTRAPGGSYVERPLRIVRLSKLLSPPGVSAVLLDRPAAAEVYARAREWAPDSVPDWPSASAAEREQYAFWHDDNDEVTAGVSEHSVWI